MFYIQNTYAHIFYNCLKLNYVKFFKITNICKLSCIVKNIYNFQLNYLIYCTVSLYYDYNVILYCIYLYSCVAKIPQQYKC